MPCRLRCTVSVFANAGWYDDRGRGYAWVKCRQKGRRCWRWHRKLCRKAWSSYDPTPVQSLEQAVLVVVHYQHAKIKDVEKDGKRRVSVSNSQGRPRTPRTPRTPSPCPPKVFKIKQSHRPDPKLVPGWKIPRQDSSCTSRHAMHPVPCCQTIYSHRNGSIR